MKKIIVAVDFSDASINAVSYAAFLANTFNIGLILVHAYTGTSAVDNDLNSPIYESLEELEAANKKLLEHEVERITQKFTVEIKSILKKGNPESVISEAALENNADLIVMGMKGKGESNSIFGSTSTSMIDKTLVPLLIIPKDAEFNSIDTITLASDFNDEKILIHFKTLQQIISKFDPFLHILNVQKEDAEIAPEVTANKMQSSQVWDTYSHSFNVIEMNNIEEGINKFLKENPSDILAMVARKRNFIQKILGTSHTKRMTQQTEIPLLVLHE